MKIRKILSNKHSRRIYRLPKIPSALGTLLAFCLCLLMCTGISGIAARASGASGSEEIPRVTFTNGANHSPDLYVTKEVTSADPAYQAPDIAFRFTLKLDGKLASGLQYRVFGADGGEVLNENAVPFATDRSGGFYLKAGQKAKFEYVGTGTSYEVTEGSAEHFTQVAPAGGAAASGTVLPDGSSVKFVNRYVPDKPDEPDDPVNPDPETTKLTVSKYISFPHRFRLPQDTPEFGFTLRIDGKPYAGQPFIIVDNEYGEPKEDGSAGTTDEKGHFAIPGGCTAVFEEVPADADYYVKEDETENWRVVGSDVREGATKKPLTEINYTNATASFAVTKTVRGMSGTGEDIFTFILLDEQKTGWNGAEYYLYTTAGEQVTDANGDAVKGTTDGRGQFTLAAGQAAVFTGIAPGTVYSVKEQVAAGYVQAVPKSAAGYENKTVRSSVEVLPFVNEPEEQEEKVLTVTKLMEYKTGETPKEEEIFTFVLTRK